MWIAIRKISLKNTRIPLHRPYLQPWRPLTIPDADMLKMSLKRTSDYWDESWLQETFQNLPRIWSWIVTTLYPAKLVWRVWSWKVEAVWNKMDNIGKRSNQQLILSIGLTSYNSKDWRSGLPDYYPPAYSTDYCFVFYCSLRGARTLYKACLCLFYSVCFTLLVFTLLFYPACFTLLVLPCLFWSEHCFSS